MNEMQDEEKEPAPPRPVFASWTEPVFDGPDRRKPLHIPNDLKLNTENAGE